MKPKQTIQEVYEKLYAYYGPQHWWPGDTKFEIAIGAILTQNTAWTNVEKAIRNLKPYLDPQILHDLSDDMLQECIRPSGFYQVKTKRIKNFLSWFSRERVLMGYFGGDGST